MQEHVLYQKKITFQKGDNKFVWGSCTAEQSENFFRCQQCSDVTSFLAVYIVPWLRRAGVCVRLLAVQQMQQQQCNQ